MWASSPPKYRAHLPATTIPSNLYFHSIEGASACSPELVSVVTDGRTKAKVSPMISEQMPACIAPDQARFYQNAVEMAQRGNSLVFVLKECGVHQSTLYSCPVTQNTAIVGVLIAIDAALEKSPSPTSSSISSQEKDMIDTMCSLNSLAIH